MGRILEFHGAFKIKKKAKKKEKKTGGFIITRKIRGERRYIVAKKRGK